MTIQPTYTNDAAVIILPEGPFYIERHIDGLDRRVFRYTGNGCDGLEFAYYNEWVNAGGRSRWYGYFARQMPQSIQDIL